MYELELILPGAWADVESSNMVTVQFLMQLLTLATIPLALFLFKIGYVHSDLHTDESHVSRKLLFWGSVRNNDALRSDDTQHLLLLCLRG